MKTFIALTALLTSICAFATPDEAPADISKLPKKTIIYCFEPVILTNQPISRVVEIKSQDYRAANYLETSLWDNKQDKAVGQEVSSLVYSERGSIEEGMVHHAVARFDSHGYQNYLYIRYPWGQSKLNGLPAIYVGIKNGKEFSVPMNCTHMDTNRE